MMSLKVILSITITTWCIGGFVGALPKTILDSTVLIQKYNFQVSFLLFIQILTSTFIAFVILVTYLILYIIYQRKMMKKTTITMKYPIKTAVIAMLSCASFIISWEPFLVSLIAYYIFCTKGDSQKDICTQISTSIVNPLPITSLLNAFINPSAYIWWHKPFIQDMKHIYCSKRLREQKRKEFIKDIESTLGPYITHL